MKKTLSFLPLFLLLNLASAQAQDYVPVAPNLAEHSIDTSWFSFNQNGLNFSGQGVALKTGIIPSTSHLSCTSIFHYRYANIRDSVEHIEYCGGLTQSYGQNYTQTYTDLHVVATPPRAFLAYEPLKKLNMAQFSCMRAQYDAFNEIAGTPEAAASLSQALGAKRVSIAFEDNTKKALPDSALNYGPDASTPGAIKLRVVLNSKGECLLADASQLALTISKWKSTLASTQKPKPASGSSPKVETAPLNKSCPAPATDSATPTAPKAAGKTGDLS